MAETLCSVCGGGKFHQRGCALIGGRDYELGGCETPAAFVHPSTRHPNSARFHEILKELGALHDKKSFDYGSDKDPLANVQASTEFGIPAWVGALVRLNDKVVRLKSFARKGELKNESAEDSMRDIAVYAIISLVLYEQESREKSSHHD